jgi:hypothetical protein
VPGNALFSSLKGKERCERGKREEKERKERGKREERERREETREMRERRVHALLLLFHKLDWTLVDF